MPQFSGWNESIAILVKVSESFDEIICGVGSARFTDGLINWKKHLKADAVIWFQLLCHFFHIRLRRVLAQSAQRVTDLWYVNFSIPTAVEQLECFLEFCKQTIWLINCAPKLWFCHLNVFLSLNFTIKRRDHSFGQLLITVPVHSEHISSKTRWQQHETHGWLTCTVAVKNRYAFREQDSSDGGDNKIEAKKGQKKGPWPALHVHFQIKAHKWK